MGAGYFLGRYGLHIGLLVSIIGNVVLFTTRPSTSAAVSASLKKSFEQLARDVTQQMLDTSYLNFENNTNMLLSSGELDPPLIKVMKQKEMLPRTAAELKAISRQLADEKCVASVRIDQVFQDEPDAQGLVPVDVGGVCAKHSASGAEQTSFHLKFSMGLRKTGQLEPNSDFNPHSHYAARTGQTAEEQVPVVANLQDLSGTPMPATPSLPY